MDSMRWGSALWRAWRAAREAHEKWSEPQKRMRKGSEVFGGKGRMFGFCLGAVSVVTMWRTWWIYPNREGGYGVP